MRPSSQRAQPSNWWRRSRRRRGRRELSYRPPARHHTFAPWLSSATIVGVPLATPPAAAPLQRDRGGRAPLGRPPRLPALPPPCLPASPNRASPWTIESPDPLKRSGLLKSSSYPQFYRSQIEFLPTILPAAPPQLSVELCWPRAAPRRPRHGDPRRLLLRPRGPLGRRRGARRAPSAAPSGAAASFVVMAVHIACGYRYGALLLAFFSASKVTGEDRKRRVEDDFKEGGQRNW